MPKRKYLIGVLSLLNVCLLLLIGIVMGSRIGYTEKQGMADWPVSGQDISGFLEEHSPLRREILQTEARTVVLLFFRDSSFARSIEYTHEFSRCVTPSPVQTVLFIVVCHTQEKCENIRIPEVDNVREPFSVRFYSDNQANFRRRFAVHHGATMILDTRSLKISQSYSYLVNPFVLCELLEREENNVR
jgi:hypothetical protein